MFNWSMPKWRAVWILQLGLLLAACGGGGGNSGAAPTLGFSAAPRVAAAPLTVRLEASGGGADGYTWDFGDGQSGTGASLQHTYTEAGVYTVTLSATGADGRRASTSQKIVAVGQGLDPLADRQWHIDAMQADAVWNNGSCSGSGCRGDGVTVAVVDDGLEIWHEDLAPNVSSTLQHRVYTTDGPRSGDPTPGRDGDGDGRIDYHGTAVAGISSARDDNGAGGTGVAPRSELVGYGVLQASTALNEADAMRFQGDAIGVFNNSWGPPDGLGRFIAPDTPWTAAIEEGLARGRGGRGSIYVWAAGNGYQGSRDYEGCAYNANQPDALYCQDNSNYDGYANHRGVIAVAALTRNQRRAAYSEPGANLWVSAPGGEHCSYGPDYAITTADLSGDAGLNGADSASDLRETEVVDARDYTRCMNGTSAAAPMVSGVVALMLQANPELNWRQVRYILATTATKVDDPAVWRPNGAGHTVSHLYGFGAVDAAEAVSEAPTPQDLGELRRHTTSGAGTSWQVSGSGINHIEWVDLSVESDHASPGDLEIVLTSPSGPPARLAAPHACADNYCGMTRDVQGNWTWRFGVAHYLDESADGRWTLSVRDSSDQAVALRSWQLDIYGNAAPYVP